MIMFQVGRRLWPHSPVVHQISVRQRLILLQHVTGKQVVYWSPTGWEALDVHGILWCSEESALGCKLPKGPQRTLRAAEGEKDKTELSQPPSFSFCHFR